MNCPPYLMRLRIHRRDKKLNLWIPLFIILPIVAVIALLLAPIVLVAIAVLWPFGRGKPLLIAAPIIFNCLCALRGLEADINHAQERISISVK